MTTGNQQGNCEHDNDDEECECEYPHLNDFDFAVFEMCTCKPDCWHIAPVLPPASYAGGN